MGVGNGNKQLILKKSPEKLVLLQRLYNYDRSKTFAEKFKQFFKKKDKSKANSISDWCKILGKAPTNNDCRALIEDLWDMDAFEKTGETHNGHPLLVLDRHELLRCYGESILYSSQRDMIFDVINKFEDGRKVVTDW